MSSLHRWPLSPLDSNWTAGECLRELANLLQDRVEAYQRPTLDETEVSEAIRGWAFGRSLDEEFSRVDLQRAITWLKIHAAGIVPDVKRRIKELRRRIP